MHSGLKDIEVGIRPGGFPSLHSINKMASSPYKAQIANRYRKMNKNKKPAIKNADLAQEENPMEFQRSQSMQFAPEVFDTKMTVGGDSLPIPVKKTTGSAARVKESAINDLAAKATQDVNGKNEPQKILASSR